MTTSPILELLNIHSASAGAMLVQPCDTFWATWPRWIAATATALACWPSSSPDRSSTTCAASSSRTSPLPRGWCRCIRSRRRIGATKRCARPPAAAGWTRTRCRTASGAPPAGPSMTTAGNAIVECPAVDSRARRRVRIRGLSWSTGRETHLSKPRSAERALAARTTACSAGMPVGAGRSPGRSASCIAASTMPRKSRTAAA